MIPRGGREDIDPAGNPPDRPAQNLLHLFGNYGLQTVSDLLLSKRNETHPTERADLFGKRLAATIETDQGRAFVFDLMCG